MSAKKGTRKSKDGKVSSAKDRAKKSKPRESSAPIKGGSKSRRRQSSQKPRTLDAPSPTQSKPRSVKTSAPSSGTKSKPRNVSPKSKAKPRESKSSYRNEAAIYSSARRAEAARAGWITRRANAVSNERVRVNANPGDAASGDFAYALYDKAHPLHGEHETIEFWHGKLKQFYGKRVRVTVNGYTTNPDTEHRTRIFIRRVGQLDGYGSMFGPGSLYSAAVKVVRNRHSNDELVVTSVTVELADDDDDDGESE